MAFIECKFHSESLKLATSMNVILPQQTSSQIGMKGKSSKGKFPVLYLLHGMSDDQTIWGRRTSIERYAAPLGLAVVMPCAGRSFYTDMASGSKYWTFISEELPAIARSFFPLSEKREDNFVAGLSMGGYGAFKLAFRKPENFSFAASLSGALDIPEFFKASPPIKDELTGIFGPEKKVPGSDNDFFHLAEKLFKSKKQAPALFMSCGTEDYLCGSNQKFKKHLEGLKADFIYDEAPGNHEWGYWDLKIQRVLSILPLKK
ncbi:MAG: esterase [Lentisphaerae bacterium GWF2_45_14]|nr:MAG: esterase [Lentisphaerae bacterium GWF2_45_14]